MSISQDLTFRPDSTRECVVVLLVQDEVCESTMTESFGVRLTNRENGNTVQDTATVVIYDASECSECVDRKQLSDEQVHVRIMHVHAYTPQRTA